MVCPEVDRMWPDATYIALEWPEVCRKLPNSLVLARVLPEVAIFVYVARPIEAVLQCTFQVAHIEDKWWRTHQSADQLIRTIWGGLQKFTFSYDSYSIWWLWAFKRLNYVSRIILILYVFVWKSHQFCEKWDQSQPTLIFWSGRIFTFWPRILTQLLVFNIKSLLKVLLLVKEL